MIHNLVCLQYAPNRTGVVRRNKALHITMCRPAPFGREFGQQPGGRFLQSRHKSLALFFAAEPAQTKQDHAGVEHAGLAGMGVERRKTAVGMLHLQQPVPASPGVFQPFALAQEMSVVQQGLDEIARGFGISRSPFPKKQSSCGAFSLVHVYAALKPVQSCGAAAAKFGLCQQGVGHNQRFFPARTAKASNQRYL